MKEISTYQAMESEGILLNANESFTNLSLAIRKEIAEKMIDMPFQRYPIDGSDSLISAYASFSNKKKTQIIAGNGSDEMLGLLIGLTMKEGKKLYTLHPDFSMYDYYCGMHGGKMVTYAMDPEKPFCVEQFIAKGKNEQVDMILFSNPNNPTGRVIAPSNLIKIVEAFPRIPVVIDEAYADFDETTMLDYVDQYPHLFVTRTLSKAFALAGARIGFLIGNEATMQRVVPYKVPYNVNRMSEIAGCVVLSHQEEINQNIAWIKQARDSLYQKIAALKKENITIYPSKTNYLYGKSKDKEKLLSLLKKKNIVIRNYADDSFRITIGDETANEMVYEIIKAL